MKKTLIKDQTITFKERTSQGFKEKSFDCPKEHLEFHIKQMQNPYCKDIRVSNKKG